jgi:hypothetical protein
MISRRARRLQGAVERAPTMIEIEDTITRFVVRLVRFGMAPEEAGK